MSGIDYAAWEPVIGLEIHVQLDTQTKLFSRAPNRFGAEPNTLISFVDTGQPGTLPVLNATAVEYAVRLGLALDAEIMPFSTFDRKSYFYPDSPRNFQITQYLNPIIRSGTVTCDVDGHTRHFPVDRAQLEDDAGMLKHFSSFTGIDYNRAGAPLVEIISKPALHAAKEASAFAMSVRTTMQYLGIAKCNMQEGGMRIDVNISVRPKGEKGLRPKIEIKNLNSFRNLELAIASEMRRQIEAYARNPRADFNEIVRPGTYRFDLDTRQTVLMRSKENALDYRYFHEPDLPPILLSTDLIERIRSELPELPYERYSRYIDTFQLLPESAAVLIADKFCADFFEEALALCHTPQILANWITVEFFGRLKEKGLTLQTSGLKAPFVGRLVQLLQEKTITGRIAKAVADDMLNDPEKDPRHIVKENPNYCPVSDIGVIGPIVDQVVRDHPQSIKDYKLGRTKALSFLVGQVMKQTKGKAQPDLVNQLLLEKIQHL